MRIDPQNYPKADLAVRYRSDIQDAIKALDKYLPRYETVLLDTLESNPQVDAQSLKEFVFAAHDADYRVYENDALNDALVELSHFGNEAVEELKQAIDVLGETLDLETAKGAIATKYQQISSDEPVETPTNVDSAEIIQAALDHYGASVLTDLMLPLQISRKNAFDSASGFVWNGKVFSTLQGAIVAARTDGLTATRQEAEPLEAPIQLSAREDSEEPGLTGFSANLHDHEPAPQRQPEPLKESSAGVYIGAWFVLGFFSTVLGLIAGAAYGIVGDWNGYSIGMGQLFAFAILNILAVVAGWILTYRYVFRRTNPMKVMPYVYVLGAIGSLAEMGNMLSDPFTSVRVSDATVVVFAIAQFVIIALVLRAISWRIRSERGF